MTNFGFTDGILPTGYMSSTMMIDWHSQLSTYEDQNFITQGISASGASIAQTRCSQVADSVVAMGFAVSGRKWFQYGSQTETVYDPSADEYIEVTSNGNKTLCEMEKKCNTDSPDFIVLNKAQCTGDLSKVLQCSRFV